MIVCMNEKMKIVQKLLILNFSLGYIQFRCLTFSSEVTHFTLVSLKEYGVYIHTFTNIFHIEVWGSPGLSAHEWARTRCITVHDYDSTRLLTIAPMHGAFLNDTVPRTIWTDVILTDTCESSQRMDTKFSACTARAM